MGQNAHPGLNLVRNRVIYSGLGCAYIVLSQHAFFVFLFAFFSSTDFPPGPKQYIYAYIVGVRVHGCGIKQVGWIPGQDRNGYRGGYWICTGRVLGRGASGGAFPTSKHPPGVILMRGSTRRRPGAPRDGRKVSIPTIATCEDPPSIADIR